MTNYANIQVLFDGQDASASFNSAWTDVSNLDKGSIHLKVTGTVAGSIKLQCANDTTYSPVDLVGTSVAISGAGAQMFTFPLGFGFKFVRLSYTATSGTGTMSATMMTYDDN